MKLIEQYSHTIETVDPYVIPAIKTVLHTLEQIQNSDISIKDKLDLNVQVYNRLFATENIMDQHLKTKRDGKWVFILN